MKMILTYFLQGSKTTTGTKNKSSAKHLLELYIKFLYKTLSQVLKILLSSICSNQEIQATQNYCSLRKFDGWNLKTKKDKERVSCRVPWQLNWLIRRLHCDGVVLMWSKFVSQSVRVEDARRGFSNNTGPYGWSIVCSTKE